MNVKRERGVTEYLLQVCVSSCKCQNESNFSFELETSVSPSRLQVGSKSSEICPLVRILRKSPAGCSCTRLNWLSAVALKLADLTDNTEVFKKRILFRKF